MIYFKLPYFNHTISSKLVKLGLDNIKLHATLQCAELLPNINQGSPTVPPARFVLRLGIFYAHILNLKGKLEMNATRPICAVLNYIQKKLTRLKECSSCFKSPTISRPVLPSGIEIAECFSNDYCAL